MFSLFTPITTITRAERIGIFYNCILHAYPNRNDKPHFIRHIILTPTWCY